MEKTKEQKEQEEKELEDRAKALAEIVSKSNAETMENFKKDIASLIDEKMTAKENDSVMKVFVADDVEKSIKELTKEEKIKAYAYALFTADKVALKALSEGTDADGGYTVPQDFYNELIVEIREAAVMRSLITVVPMKGKTLTLAMGSHGPDVYWTAETQTKSTATMDFSQPTITAYKMAAIIYLSDELIDDSAFDLVNILVKLFAERIAEEEDKVIVNGTGTGQPTGIFAAGTISTRACSGNLDFDDIIDLIYDLPIKYRPNARFLVNPANVRELRKLKDGNSRYIWQDPVAPGQPATIYGYPVVENYWVPEANIGFGDIKRCYWLGDRQKMTVKITNDTETTFTKDETAIRVVERIGGTVIVPNAMRVLNTIP